MPNLIIEPLLAGLATGLFCCTSCYPFLLPVFAAETYNNTLTRRAERSSP